MLHKESVVITLHTLHLCSRS